MLSFFPAIFLAPVYRDSLYPVENHVWSRRERERGRTRGERDLVSITLRPSFLQLPSLISANQAAPSINSKYTLIFSKPKRTCVSTYFRGDQTLEHHEKYLFSYLNFNFESTAGLDQGYLSKLLMIDAILARKPNYNKKASVNEKTLQLFKLEIEEIKIKSKNPLGG